MNGLKRYKHIIYIKECRPLATVQYELTYITKNTKKWEEKRMKNVYKLGEKWTSCLSNSKLSLTAWSEKKMMIFIDSG